MDNARELLLSFNLTEITSYLPVQELVTAQQELYSVGYRICPDFVLTWTLSWIGEEVEGVFGPNGQFDLNFIRVNAQQRYYDKLAGVTEPEAKRKIIGEEFIRIFEEEAKKIGAGSNMCKNCTCSAWGATASAAYDSIL